MLKRLRTHLVVATAILLSAGVACTKPAPPPASEPAAAPSEHIERSPVATAQTVLEKTFPLKGSAAFPFEIPAHALQPHLHGIFQSFSGQVHGPSDETANIDFLILTEEQQANLASGRESDVLFSVEKSHNQSVNFDLPASMTQPVKYYLVFRNSPGSKGNKMVEANFHLDF